MKWQKNHTKTYCLITTKNLVKKLGDIGLTPAPSSWWGLKLINGVKVTWGAGVRSYTTTTVEKRGYISANCCRKFSEEI